MTDSFVQKTSRDLARGIRTREYSPVEVIDDFLERIEEREAETNGFITIMSDRARKAAQEAERDLASGKEIGPLHGVPVAVKDSIAVAHTPLTFGTKLLDANIPDEDAEIVRRLRDAGAIIIGKTNLSAFGLYSGSHNKLIGSTSNPFNSDKTVGGSSGGSAAVVADGQAPLALGSDGGGSLRMPASACGIYTIKPTFGVIGNYTPNRTNAFQHTPMQSAGPMSRTVEDAAFMLDVIAGPHPRDPFSVPDVKTPFLEATKRSISDLKIAYIPALDLYPINDQVKCIVDEAVTAFDATNATVKTPTLDFDNSRQEITNAFMVGSSVRVAELAERLKEEFNIDILGKDSDAILPYLLQQFEQGYSHSALEYLNSDAVRTSVFDTIQDLFSEFDLLLSATLLVPPFDDSVHKERPGPASIDGEQLDDYRWGTLIDWRTTQIFNMTGHPSASIPAGFTNENLPIGLQITGRRFEDETVIAASATYERLRPWRDLYPYNNPDHS